MTTKYVFVDFREMSDDDVRRFLNQSTAAEALQLARSPYCPAFAFRELCEYPDTYVRAAMASRKGHEAAQISRKLGMDKEISVLECVAMNPCSDQMILSALTRHDSDYVAQIAAENPRTPGDAVDAFYVRKWTR